MNLEDSLRKLTKKLINNKTKKNPLNILCILHGWLTRQKYLWIQATLAISGNSIKIEHFCKHQRDKEGLVHRQCLQRHSYRTGILITNTVRSQTESTELYLFMSLYVFQKTSFPTKTASIPLAPNLPVRLPFIKFLPDKHHECSIVLRRKKLTSNCLVGAERLGTT